MLKRLLLKSTRQERNIISGYRGKTLGKTIRQLTERQCLQTPRRRVNRKRNKLKRLSNGKSFWLGLNGLRGIDMRFQAITEVEYPDWEANELTKTR